MGVNQDSYLEAGRLGSGEGGVPSTCLSGALSP